MLKLLRWLVAFVLLAFLIVWPIAAGLAIIVWFMGRMLYAHPAAILNLGIIAVGGMLFLSAVLGIPLVVSLLVAAAMVFISYKPVRSRPQPKTKPPVDDSDVIDVEVISERTVYRGDR